jgi:hypothetical protein
MGSPLAAGDQSEVANMDPQTAIFQETNHAD